MPRRRQRHAACSVSVAFHPSHHLSCSKGNRFLLKFFCRVFACGPVTFCKSAKNSPHKICRHWHGNDLPREKKKKKKNPKKKPGGFSEKFGKINARD